MSLGNAQELVSALNNDKEFAKTVFNGGSLTAREQLWREHGHDCSAEDVAATYSERLGNQQSQTSLPQSQQGGGPCHTKCAPQPIL